MRDEKIIEDFIKAKKEELNSFSPRINKGVVNSFGEFIDVLKAIDRGQDPNKFFKFKDEEKNFQSYFGNTIIAPGELIKFARSFLKNDNCPDGLTPLAYAVSDFISDYKNGEFEIKTLVPERAKTNDVVNSAEKRGGYIQPLSARFNKKYSAKTKEVMDNIVKKSLENKNRGPAPK